MRGARQVAGGRGCNVGYAGCAPAAVSPAHVWRTSDSLPGTLALLLDRTPANATTPTFTTPAQHAAELGTNNVALVDLDGDGQRDLVVTNSALPSDVLVARNTTPPNATAASFADVGSFPVAMTPFAVVAVDLDGDAKLDLAVAAHGENKISTLRNTSTAAGAITFAPSTDHQVDSEPETLAVGRLDGLPFVASANSLGETVSVLHGPSLSSREDFAVHAFVLSVATGDFNRDGKVDLVTAGVRPQRDTPAISILLAR